MSRGACGTTLVVSIRPVVGANDYAFEMRETLVDLSKGTSELQQFHDAFFAEVNQIRKQKESTDLQNKPHL